MVMIENTTELLVELREIKDQKDALNGQLSALHEREEAINKQLLGVHEASGLESLSGGGLSVHFDPHAMRAKYEPEQWAGIVAWAVATGRDYIVQRRLSDGKILDLVKEGVELPEGLTLEGYTKISVRRK